MTVMNQQIVLAARPTGLPMDSDFELIEPPVPPVRDGEVLVRALYLSVDPYMRGWIRENPGYSAPMKIGEVMPGGVVGVVEHSRHRSFADGEIVEGMLGWQAYAISDGGKLRKVDPDLAPISTALGILGMPGLTAHFGIIDIAQTKSGESVFISGAAGAVGSVAGQIAKILGCHVAGSTGTDEKVEHLIGDLGFDAAFNYKSSEDYSERIRTVCPHGIDVYFDNVGGAMTDAVIPRMNLRGRVAVCGQISQYNLERPEQGPRWLFHTVLKRLRVEGFLVFDYERQIPDALEQMSKWFREGKLRYRETITRGLASAPDAFIGMLCGRNTGKQLVKVGDL